jgi:hypothetical protein
MMNSQILLTILETNGLAKQTQVKIKKGLVTNSREDQQDGAKPSGTSNDPMDLSR